MARSAAALRRMLFLPALLLAQALPRIEQAIDVHLFDIAVTVRDRDGRLVPDLAREDLEILVDGRPVTIVNFARVVNGELEAGADPAAEPAVPTDNEWAPSGITWAVFIDHRGTNVRLRNQALRELRENLPDQFRAGDRAMVARFSDRLEMLVPITGSRDAFVEGLQQAGRSAPLRSSIRGRIASLRTEIQQAAAPGGRGGRSEAEELTSLIEFEMSIARSAIEALGSFFDALAGQEERVAAIYVGPGIESIASASLVELWRAKFYESIREPWAPDSEARLASLASHLERLESRILASRATCYAIYTGDRHEGQPDVEDAGGGELELPPKSDRNHWIAIGAARAIAEATGGRLLTTTPGLGGRLEVVWESLRNYYSLGFTHTAEPGTSLRVDVRTRKPGYRVEHRTGVRRRSSEEAADAAVVSALFGGGNPVNPLDISVEVSNHPDSRRRKQLRTVSLAVPWKSLRDADPQQQERRTLKVVVAVSGRQGAVWRFHGRSLPVIIPPANSPSVVDEMKYSVAVPVPPQPLHVAVLVEDESLGIRSIVVEELR